MYFKHDLLETVQAELRRRKGTLRNVAYLAGMSYDSLLRVMRGSVDPGYSKVRQAAVALGLAPAPEPKKPAKKRAHR